MAGRKFLSPAHFQDSRGIAASSVSKTLKLLPPMEYESVTERDGLSLAVRETGKGDDIDKLQEENKRLKHELEKAREDEMKLQEQNRRNKVLLQRSRVDDALDLKRMAEAQEENVTLQAELRKQSAIISKLRTEAKHLKSVSEMEVTQSEAEVEKSATLIKQLKMELKEKEAKFESELEGLEKRCKRQNFMIKDLKSELHKAREQVQVDRAGFENIISKSEYQKYEEVKKLEQCLKKSEESFSLDLETYRREVSMKEQLIDEIRKEMASQSVELKSLKEELESREADKISKIMKYKEQLQTSQVSFDQRTVELERALNESSMSHKDAVNKLKRKLQETQEELQSQITVVSQLRAYIGKNLPDSQLERLKQENNELQKDLSGLTQENRSLRTTVDLLNVRLSSLSEILSIQDAELKKSLTSPGSQSQGENLITVWREKVYTLLVQLKSQEITQEHEKRLENAEVKGLTQQLSGTRKELAVLSHTLADRNAELQIEANKVRSLQEELGECKANAQRQQSHLSKYELVVENLHQISETTESWMKNFGAIMEEAFTKLAIFSQRINFASGRVRFLQGLFAHREAQWKQEFANTVSKSKELEETKAPDGSEAEQVLSYQQLSLEVERLTRERDLLVSQIQQDASTMDERASTAREEYSAQLHGTEVRIEQLESILKEERERSAAVCERLETAEENLQEARDTIEMLKTDLAKHKGIADKALDKAVAEERARFAEEFAKLEHQLNDVRREHTKAVVSLRQAERQVAREQGKAEGQLAQERREYEASLEKNKVQLMSLEKERNMLMATVRQEGLRVPRPKAKDYESSSDESEKDGEKENRNQQQLGKRKSDRTTSARTLPKTSQSSRNHLSETPHLPAEKEQDWCSQDSASKGPLDINSMAHVLKDLQSLSTALLTMEKEPKDIAQHPLEDS